ncbi:MAG TPA: hypothetical protein VFR37_16670, partial [Longimicrobium sp.]|nr:hypothetical protein [Longimicrobium sp.]
RIRDDLAARGVRLAGGAGYLRRILATTRGQAIPVAECGPGRRFLFVDERGRAAPCSFTAGESGIPRAEIGSAEALRDLPRRFAEARRVRRARPCGDCHATHVFEKFDPGAEKESGLTQSQQSEQSFVPADFQGAAREAGGVVERTPLTLLTLREARFFSPDLKMRPAREANDGA